MDMLHREDHRDPKDAGIRFLPTQKVGRIIDVERR